MRETLPLSYTETVENTTIEQLLKIYESALDKCDFTESESSRAGNKLHHRSIWGVEQESERKRIIGFEAIKEEMQRFCAQATFEQMGNDVRFELEIVPWMESADAPEVPGVTQGERERVFDDIYARFKLEEILSAMPGVGAEPDDILYAPHYENLPRQEKLKKLEQRFQDGKISREVYEKIKEWIEAGN